MIGAKAHLPWKCQSCHPHCLQRGAFLPQVRLTTSALGTEELRESCLPALVPGPQGTCDHVRNVCHDLEGCHSHLLVEDGKPPGVLQC